MKTLLNTLVFAFIITTFNFSNAIAQQAKPKLIAATPLDDFSMIKTPRNDQEKAMVLTTILSEQLVLSGEQSQKVYQIFATTFSKTEEYKMVRATDEEAFVIKMKSLYAQKEAQLSALLTTDQVNLYEEIKASKAKMPYHTPSGIETISDLVGGLNN